MTLHPIPLNFLIYEENFILFFISVLTNERCPYDNSITAIQNHLLQADKGFKVKKNTAPKQKKSFLLEHSLKFTFVYSH
jgi:hypothetical protein